MPDLNFEANWIVTVSDVEISCRRPNGEIESVTWDDLKIVVIETTDEGPYAPDVFWYLAGEKSGCVVPNGATGEEEMLKHLQLLPNFDNEALISAMSSTDNNKFVCWKRDN